MARWTRMDSMRHAALLRRKANGFYTSAARAALIGNATKADRLFGRGVELDVSATAHERRARGE